MFSRPLVGYHFGHKQNRTVAGLCVQALKWHGCVAWRQRFQLIPSRLQSIYVPGRTEETSEPALSRKAATEWLEAERSLIIDIFSASIKVNAFANFALFISVAVSAETKLAEKRNNFYRFCDDEVGRSRDEVEWSIHQAEKCNWIRHETHEWKSHFPFSSFLIEFRDKISEFRVFVRRNSRRGATPRLEIHEKKLTVSHDRSQWLSRFVKLKSTNIKIRFYGAAADWVNQIHYRDTRRNFLKRQHLGWWDDEAFQFWSLCDCSYGVEVMLLGDLK